MAFNIHPYTTVIEIAEIAGQEEQFYQIVVGYNDITTFEGCTDVGNKRINCADDQKSNWSGDSYSDITSHGTSTGCDTPDYLPYHPGGNKIFKMRMVASSFVGNLNSGFHAEEVDTDEIYRYGQSVHGNDNLGWKTVKFKEKCESYVSQANPSDMYDLSTNKFTNTAGDGLKVAVNMDIYVNAVSAGPHNTNSLSVALSLKHRRATDGKITRYQKYSWGSGPRMPSIGSADANDKCAINCYLNTQNYGGFGFNDSNGSASYGNSYPSSNPPKSKSTTNSTVWMGMGDTLEVQIRMGTNDGAMTPDGLSYGTVDNTDDATKLCDGGFPSPPGLGLSQTSNCMTGMGTNVYWNLNFDGVTQVAGSIPSFCTHDSTKYVSSSHPTGTDMGVYTGLSHGQPWIPLHEDCDCHTAGSSLYFKKHNQPGPSASDANKKQSNIIFDIINHSYVGDSWDNWDYLLLKGDGSDSYPSSLSNLVPDWHSGLGQVDAYNWYISKYQHSSNWDSSGVGFKFALDRDDRDTILSYEDEHEEGNHHDVYSTEGGLGMRHSEFFKLGYDCYELTVKVSSITNCILKIHEGTASDPALTPTNPTSISSPGEYVFCLAALARTGMWTECGGWTIDGTQNYSCSQDGVVMHDPLGGNGNGQWFSHFGAGGIKILTAEPTGTSGTHECLIDDIIIKKMQPEISTVSEPIYGGNYTYEIPLYDWQQLDVLESAKVPLSLTFSVGDLKDITKRTAGFSKTFNLPASAHNETVLNNMLAVGAERQKIGWKKGRIKANGIVVFNGLMRIEQGVTGKGGFYKCHIIEDTIDWAKAIGDKELCDINILQPDPQPKDREQIIQSWSQHKPYNFDRAGAMGSGVKYAEDYFWGVASYGAWHRKSLGIDHKHDTYDFHPVIFCRRMVIKIFEQSGYSLSSKFWDSVTASLLCHPFGSGEDYYSTDPMSALGGSGSALGQAKHPGGACAGNYSSGGMIPAGGSDRTWYPVLNVVSDIDNNITGTSANKYGGASNKGYVVPFAGEYDITVKYTLHNSNSWWQTNFGSDSRITGYLLKNGVSMGSTFTSTYWGSGTFTTYVDSGLRNLNANDIISFKVVGESHSNTYDCWQDCENINVLIFPTFSTSPPPQLVEFSKIVACGTKQIDYLHGLTKMFNLQWTADEQSKTVYCEPYDDFFGSGKQLNWTDRLDKTSWTDKFIVEELAKKVSFEYAEDSGDVGMNGVQAWRDANGYNIYKSHLQEHEEKFRKEELKLGTEFFARTLKFNAYGTQSNPGVHSPTHPYAPNGIGWGDMAWKNSTGSNSDSPCMPIIWMEEGGHMNGSSGHRPPFVEYPQCDMRILNYYSLLNGRRIDGSGNQSDFSVTGCTNWVFYETNNETLDHFPHMNWIDDYKNGVGEDPYNLSWGDYTTQGITSKGLYQKYWHTAYQKMNGGAALRTCKMALTPNDIAGFDYRDLIVLTIDDVPTYWTVNKIKDYKPNQEVLTTVELIEWKNANDFAKRRTPREDEANQGLTKIHQLPIKVNVGVNKSSYKALQKTNLGGVSLENDSGNISTGGGIALGHGVVANSRQTVLGNFNSPNSSAIFQVGSGSGNKQRNTAFEITNEGEVQIHGGNLVVQETDGTIHEIVYDEEVINIENEIEKNVKKVYLSKTITSDKAKGVTSQTRNSEGSGGGY